MWIYFQECQSWIYLRELVSLDEFNFSFWIFHVTSQDCIVKESCEYMSEYISHHPAKSDGIGLVEGEILSFQFDTCSCDHIIRVVRIHYGFRFNMCQHTAKFGGHTSFGGWNISFLIC